MSRTSESLHRWEINSMISGQAHASVPSFIRFCLVPLSGCCVTEKALTANGTLKAGNLFPATHGLEQTLMIWLHTQLFQCLWLDGQNSMQSGCKSQTGSSCAASTSCSCTVMVQTPAFLSAVPLTFPIFLNCFLRSALPCWTINY